MGVDPYKDHPLSGIIQSHIDRDTDSVLDLCCGIGTIMHKVFARKIDAVDVYEKYVRHYQRKLKRKDIRFHCIDALFFVKHAIAKRWMWDVVVCIDGIEHLEKNRAISLLLRLPKIAIKRILIFTPEGLTLNEPHDTWGIKGGDEYQRHQCGFDRAYMESIGYEVIYSEHPENQYDGTTYTNHLYSKSLI